MSEARWRAVVDFPGYLPDLDCPIIRTARPVSAFPYTASN
jgi:hypothetical protein